MELFEEGLDEFIYTILSVYCLEKEQKKRNGGKIKSAL